MVFCWMLLFKNLRTTKNKTFMGINFLALLLVAVSTLVVGCIWYNPKVFGTIGWTKPVWPKRKRKAPIWSWSLEWLSFMPSSLYPLVITIHQFGALGMVGGDPTLAKPSYEAFMADYLWQLPNLLGGAFHDFSPALFRPSLWLHQCFIWKKVLEVHVSYRRFLDRMLHHHGRDHLRMEAKINILL